MAAAFLIQGFSPDQTFNSPSLDALKESMMGQGILLHGVTDGWGENSVQGFGQRAVEQSRQCEFDGILIGHSLGALAALSVVDAISLRHLVLCSPSALFSEDIEANLNPEIAERIGKKRVQELSGFSAAKATSLVNRMAIPTTVMFGEKERERNPSLVARCGQLAAGIIGAELIEVTGAGHSIGDNPYADDVARVVGDIAARLSSVTPTSD